MKLRNLWQIFSRPKPKGSLPATPAVIPETGKAIVPEVEIAPDDPLIEYFQNSPGIAEIDNIHLESPALKALREAGVTLAVPLVSQGELIGLLNLGPRLSEQDYSSDDLNLLSNLATQAAPALRVAQLVKQQQAEAQARERIEHELSVARLIQQTLLPKELPSLPGWNLAAYYQPARAVGGDFYDFLTLPDGRLALIIGDVTDKGVPAAIVMATTRSVLRSAAETSTDPGQVLERANNLLCPDIPEKMFITCLYAILDPGTGKLVFANAGHDLPYRRCADGVDELRATGMPLGLMEGMTYETKEVQLTPGDSILFYSDGLVEAHSPQGEMFGFPRLRERLAEHPGGPSVIEYLLGVLYDFTQPGWEQEDDVTFLAIQWTEAIMPISSEINPTEVNLPGSTGWKILAEFEVPSQPGNERQVMEKVGQAAQAAGMPASRLERLKTAAAEAAMNAMEHGNHYQADLPVSVRVLSSGEAVSVQITDRGSGEQIPEPELPDLDAKLAGLQTPRGWGLFLIKNMVDEMNVTSEESFHRVELIMNFEGGKNEPSSL